jgi:polysaccharide biosynthesis protein PslH
VNNTIKILVVAPDFPYPPLDGHKVRIYNLFRQCPKGYRFDFISFREDHLMPNRDTLKRQLGPCFDGVELIPHSSLKRIEMTRGIASIKNIFYPYEKSIGEPYFSNTMVERIREQIASKRYDLVFLCGLYISLYFDKSSVEIPCIVDIGDSMSLLAKSYFESERNLIKRAKKYLNYVWADRYEKIHCSRLRNIIMISSADAKMIEKNCPRSRVLVVPNGVDTEYFKSNNSKSEPKKSLLFTGVMDYPPNNEAILYFIRKIFPLVRKRVPDVTLTVAGRNPTQELQALAKLTRGIRLTGFVDDIRPCFDSSLVYVSPLLSGAGIKNKILEAWSMSMPVVATSVSCSGLEAKNGENILIADKSEEFSEAILTLLSDRSLMKLISQNGRKTVEQSYSWEIRSKMLMDIFGDVLTNRL